MLQPLDNLLIGLLLLAAAGGCAYDGPVSARQGINGTDQLMQFVNQAAQKLATEGKEAFSEFNAPNSRWWSGRTFLFVLNEDGTAVIYPPSPELVGQDVSDLTDADGRPYVERIFQAVGGSDRSGWAFYRRIPPGGNEPLWKASYVRQVRTPAGEQYLIGSGVYDMPVDQALLIQMVQQAADRLKEDPKAALREIGDLTGPFVYRKTQVSVLDPSGVVLADPFYPQLVGRPPATAPRESMRQQLVNLAMQQEQGWIRFRWPKPDGGETAVKEVYVKQVQTGGQTYILAAGHFLE